MKISKGAAREIRQGLRDGRRHRWDFHYGPFFWFHGGYDSPYRRAYERMSKRFPPRPPKGPSGVSGR